MTNTLTDIPVCTMEDLGLKITGTDAPPLIDTLNEYLSAFAAPVKSERESGLLMGAYDCLKCGKPLCGALGTFQWGIVHGEGVCSSCGWPCRAYHRPKDKQGEIFEQALEMVLQYHPSKVMAEQDSD